MSDKKGGVTLLPLITISILNIESLAETPLKALEKSGTGVVKHPLRLKKMFLKFFLSGWGKVIVPSQNNSLYTD